MQLLNIIRINKKRIGYKDMKKDSLFVKVMAGILAGLMIVSVLAIAVIYFLQ
jgi:hypothetical protein